MPRIPFIADLPADPLERLHNIFAPIGEARIGRRAEPGMRVDDGQDAQLLSKGKLIMDEVHRPDVIRPGCFFSIFTQLGFHTPFRVLVSQLQTQLIVNSACLLDVDGPALPAQQNMDAPVAVPDACLADLLNPPLNSSLIRPPGLIVVAGRVETDGPTSPPYRHAPVDAHPGDEFAQTARLQSFRRMTS